MKLTFKAHIHGIKWTLNIVLITWLIRNYFILHLKQKNGKLEILNL